MMKVAENRWRRKAEEEDGGSRVRGWGRENCFYAIKETKGYFFVPKKFKILGGKIKKKDQ